MSSRNTMLTPTSRSAAPGIHRALRALVAEVSRGERSVSGLRASLGKSLRSIPGAKTDYAEIVESEALAPLKTLRPGIRARALVAVRFGTVRLIDNIGLHVPR